MSDNEKLIEFARFLKKNGVEVNDDSAMKNALSDYSTHKAQIHLTKVLSHPQKEKALMYLEKSKAEYAMGNREEGERYLRISRTLCPTCIEAEIFEAKKMDSKEGIVLLSSTLEREKTKLEAAGYQRSRYQGHYFENEETQRYLVALAGYADLLFRNSKELDAAALLEEVITLGGSDRLRIVDQLILCLAFSHDIERAMYWFEKFDGMQHSSLLFALCSALYMNGLMEEAAKMRSQILKNNTHWKTFLLQDLETIFTMFSQYELLSEHWVEGENSEVYHCFVTNIAVFSDYPEYWDFLQRYKI